MTDKPMDLQEKCERLAAMAKAGKSLGDLRAALLNILDDVEEKQRERPIYVSSKVYKTGAGF